MSEQLETIKCSEWAINSSWAVGGGADREGARLHRQAALHRLFSLLLFNPQRRTWSVTQRSIRLSEATAPTRGHEPDFYLLTSPLGGPEDTGRRSTPVPAVAAARFARFSGICGAAQHI